MSSLRLVDAPSITCQPLEQPYKTLREEESINIEGLTSPFLDSLSKLYVKGMVLDIDQISDNRSLSTVSFLDFRNLLNDKFTEPIVSLHWKIIMKSLRMTFRQSFAKQVKEKYEFIYTRAVKKKNKKKGDIEIRTRTILVERELSELFLCGNFYKATEVVLDHFDAILKEKNWVLQDSSPDYAKFFSHLVHFVKYLDARLMRETQTQKCRTGSLAMFAEYGDKHGVSRYELSNVALTCGSWHCVHCSSSNAKKMEDKLGHAMETYYRLDGGLTWFTLTIDRNLIKEKYNLSDEDSVNIATWAVINSRWHAFKVAFSREIDSRWNHYFLNLEKKDQEKYRELFSKHLFEGPMFVRKIEVQKNGSAHLHCVVRDPRLLRLMELDLEEWNQLEEHEAWDWEKKEFVRQSGPPPQSKSDYLHKMENSIFRKSQRWQGARVVNTSKANKYKDKDDNLVSLHGPHHRFLKFIVDQCYINDWGRIADIDTINSSEAISRYLTTSKVLIKEMSKKTQTEGVIVPRNARIFDSANKFEETAKLLQRKIPPPRIRNTFKSNVFIMETRESKSLKDQRKQKRLDYLHKKLGSYRKILSLGIFAKKNLSDITAESRDRMTDLYSRAGIDSSLIIQNSECISHVFGKMVKKGEQKPKELIKQSIIIHSDEFEHLSNFGMSSLFSEYKFREYITILYFVIHYLGLQKKPLYEEFVNSFPSSILDDTSFTSFIDDSMNDFIDDLAFDLGSAIREKLRGQEVLYNRNRSGSKYVQSLSLKKEITKLNRCTSSFRFKSKTLYFKNDKCFF